MKKAFQQALHHRQRKATTFKRRWPCCAQCFSTFLSDCPVRAVWAEVVVDNVWQYVHIGAAGFLFYEDHLLCLYSLLGFASLCGAFDAKYILLAMFDVDMNSVFWCFLFLRSFCANAIHPQQISKRNVSICST